MNCDYIAFEGIDGSGKSSIIEQLSKILDDNNTENKIVREPGGTKVGEGIRELLLSHDYEVDPLTEALLFCAQRSQLVNELIKPWIQNGTCWLSHLRLVLERFSIGLLEAQHMRKATRRKSSKRHSDW